MNRFDLVCELWNSSRKTITRYTLKDAKEDMQNIRNDFKSNPDVEMPKGLTTRYLYETINEFIKKQAKTENE